MKKKNFSSFFPLVFFGGQFRIGKNKKISIVPLLIMNIYYCLKKIKKKKKKNLCPQCPQYVLEFPKEKKNATYILTQHKKEIYFFLKAFIKIIPNFVLQTN